MFIYVAYKDAPELSGQSILKRRASASSTGSDEDVSVEKLLLVNPDCPVRVMLEFIRRKCKLAATTTFDLCDENGVVKGLFNLATYAYATAMFEPKRVYYVIVLKQEKEGLLVLPQVNHANSLYTTLQARVRRYITTGDRTPSVTSKVTIPSPPMRKK